MPLRFLNPNLHVILIHYPLGVFVLGVVLELFGFLWSRSSMRTAARWMIVMGGLLTLPAATSGVFALHDVMKQGISDARYHMLRMHVIYMGIASIVAVFCAVIGMGASDRWRKRLYLPLLVGVLAAVGLMVAGAWNGGETVYRQGTAVEILKYEKLKVAQDQDVLDANGEKIATLHFEGLKKGAKGDVIVPIETGHKDIQTALKDRDYQELVNYYAGGDLQQHIVSAGLAFAAALFALGLSIRRLHSNSAVREIVIEKHVTTRHDPRRGTDDISVIRSFKPEAEVGAEAAVAPGIPSGRLWLLAVLIIAGTAGLGYWVATGQTIFQKAGWDHFISILKPEDPAVKVVNRVGAHVILGISLLVLALICGVLAGFAPKKPLLLTFFSTLMILVIAAQVWIGVLLTIQKGHDDGPLTHFQTTEEADAQDARIDAKAAKEKPAKPATPESTPASEPAPAAAGT